MWAFDEGRDRVLEKYIVRSVFVCILTGVIHVTESVRMRWEVHVARVGKKRNACRGLVKKRDRNSPIGRGRRKREDDIKWILKK
jgi:hypothetical protein